MKPENGECSDKLKFESLFDKDLQAKLTNMG